MAGKAHIPRLTSIRTGSKLSTYSMAIMDGKRVSTGKIFSIRRINNAVDELVGSIMQWMNCSGMQNVLCSCTISICTLALTKMIFWIVQILGMRPIILFTLCIFSFLSFISFIYTLMIMGKFSLVIFLIYLHLNKQ